MSLLLETAILSLGMLAVCSLPLFFHRVRSSSGLLFLFGTGALFAICVFDLLPDIAELGGLTGLSLALAVGLAYSAVHLWHLWRHQNNSCCQPSHHQRAHAHSLPIFFFSIVSHCFTSGILLSISREFSEKLAGAVFLALLGHKGYESIVFVSLLLSHRLSRRSMVAAILIYCLALPAGVATSFLLRGALSHTVAIYVSSVAVGSLLGCLIFDFAIPSFRQVRQEKMRLAWIVVGIVFSHFLMRFFK